VKLIDGKGRVILMYAIKGIYDGNCFKLEESIPVKEAYEVVITFIDPVKKLQEDIFNYFDTWDDSDVENIGQIIAERKSFTLGRENI
jgi:hypothetical protein